jgi:probable rRNA maturation factor
MEPLVDTVIEDPRWEAFGLSALADRVALATMQGLGLPVQGFSLCVMGCDDARIAELNGEFRAKGTATNVLSFPSQNRVADAPGLMPEAPKAGDADDPEELGDIAISYDTCAREAVEQGKPLANHVTHLVVHGILHLLGYDHINDADAGLMEATETRILASLGVDDPYSAEHA